jgi:hypothetical protein
MYSLKFIHPKGDSILSWDLDSPDEDVEFVDCNGSMAKGFELKARPELLTIYHGASRLLELSFLEARMIFLLRLYEGKKVLREFYLETEDLEDVKQFLVKY